MKVARLKRAIYGGIFVAESKLRRQAAIFSKMKAPGSVKNQVFSEFCFSNKRFEYVA